MFDRFTVESYGNLLKLPPIPFHTGHAFADAIGSLEFNVWEAELEAAPGEWGDGI